MMWLLVAAHESHGFPEDLQEQRRRSLIKHPLRLVDHSMSREVSWPIQPGRKRPLPMVRSGPGHTLFGGCGNEVELVGVA